VADQTVATPDGALDGWEPGPPSIRSMVPGLAGGAVVPLAVYYSVRPHVHGDAPALIIAGIPAVVWVAVQLARTRRVDPIGCITVFGFAAGLIVSRALGGDAFVLKVRDSAFTALFGLSCLASIGLSKPMMFFIGRSLSAGQDPARLAAYDQLWEVAEARRAFRLITAAWGVGLVVEAALRVVLAVALPTGLFLAVSPVLMGVVIAGLMALTFRVSARARGQALAAGAVMPTAS
jgi:hypothetical protein